MAVGGSLKIHGLAELQRALDGFRTEVEERFNLLGNLAVAHVDTRTTVGVHVDVHGLGHTDGVGYLHQHLVGHAGSHHVLGDVAGSVGGRTVYLRRVLAREGAAAVGSLAAVGVDDNLTAGQSGVAVRTADDELTRRVDVVLDVEAEEVEYLLRVYLLLHARDEDVDDVVLDLGQHRVVVGKLVVLCRDDDGVNALGDALVAILYGDLTLRVGSQVGHLLAFLADGGQRADNEVG